MLIVPRIVLRRQRRGKQKRKQPGGKAGLGFILLFSLLLAASAFVLSLVYAEITSDLPSVDSIPRLLESPEGKLLQPTRIYDRTGQKVLLSLENSNTEPRVYLSLDQISPFLIDAVLASTDPDFSEHPGFTLNGLFDDKQETLAQRLAEELLLNEEDPGLRRNLRIHLLAAQMTHQYGRDQVLEWYLNSAQFGPLVYGAGSASQAYLGKEAGGLTLPEAAALAASAEMPQVSPPDVPSVIIERQRQILGEMLVQGQISPEETIEASQETITFLPAGAAPNNPAPDFTGLVLEKLSETISRSEIERGGLIVITSLDYDLQVQVNCAASEQLSRVNSDPGESVLEPNSCPAASLLPTMTSTNLGSDLQFGFRAAVIDPTNGQVLALAADRPNEILTPEETGTLINPFIYLTGFTRGLGPATLLWDIPDGIENEQAEGNMYHGPIRLRIALANDYLSPAVQVLTQLGIENTIRTARQLGLTNLNSSSLEQILTRNNEGEPAQINLLEAAQAYGVLASQGSLTGLLGEETAGSNPIQPVTLLRVETVQGQILYDCGNEQINCRVESRPVLSEELAYLVNNILSDENARWPSLGHPNFLEIGRPAGAKLGIVEDTNSGWTVGYTPQRVAAVWVGAQNQERAYSKDSVYDSTAVRISAALWRALVQYASREQPAAGWNVPAGVSTVEVCDPSGMLPTELCPTTVSEVFLMGSEPTQRDNLYRSFQVNRETSRLATVFTPPELVEEQIFMMVPPGASAWASLTGIVTPPDLYDVINAPPAPNPEVNIASPAMFGYVNGKVKIMGTASGEDFDFYRLQVGKGLNPKEWLQIGKDNKKTVENGLLGVWDTQGLSGLYALQLLVVRSNQSVDSTIIQLTADNQPPQVEILFPEVEQTFQMSSDPAIVLQTQASDDLALDRLEYYIDNELVGTILQEPYYISWQASPGAHEFRARAYDMAGNMKETSVQFSVK
ncbi:MAG: penicillin-binding protein [Chloroflexi bacterium]|nr:MAG: penicillin-binding protein [Chloroflexota bacterium]